MPSYNPTVVYGGWWWPQRPPVYQVSPPRYRPLSYNTSVKVDILFGTSKSIGRSVYSDARSDWRQYHILVSNVRIDNVHVTNNVTRNVTLNNQLVGWQHSRRNGPNGPQDVDNVARPMRPLPRPGVIARKPYKQFMKAIRCCDGCHRG